ncbi:hypothetical protein SS50377_21963 [Spironucleus salmonicida]|uniref:Uncharacterized protein n=1 Tax=Spironucleus salmonicida TaxID=348837 RepID=V6LQQ0_9EUKA|nr:hypothetical protein SS50377_21963 [Spironucleus salmonicida]|eukprot:EST47002.1 Hypothetical protein SS50377_12956 [Spironucleus salmonicida]
MTEYVEDLYAQIVLLNNLNNDLSSQLIELQQQHPTIPMSIKEKKDELLTLLQQYDNDDLKYIVDDLINDFSKQTIECEFLRAQVIDLNKKVSEKQKATIPLMYQALVEENDQLEELLVQAHAKIEDLHNQLQDNTEFTDSVQHNTQIIDHDLTQKIKENTELLAQNTQLQAEIYDVKKDNQRMKSQLQKLVKFPLKYQETASQLKDIQEQNKIELIKLSTELQKSIEHEQLYSSMISESFASNKAKDSQIKKLNGEIDKLKNKFVHSFEDQEKKIQELEMSASYISQKEKISNMSNDGSMQNFSLPQLTDSLALTNNADPMQLSNEEMTQMHQKRQNILATGATTRALSNARSNSFLLRDVNE